MTTMLIANNPTRENGSFMGDQLCYLKVAHLFVQNEKPDRVIMSMSPGNEMNFVWNKFIRDYEVEVVWDDWNPGDWTSRWAAWDRWRTERKLLNGITFDLYRELYLRIHGAQRQTILCGFERGLGRRNIYEYVYFGQENMPESCHGSDVYDCTIDHPTLTSIRDVYISPHCKTQGNYVFTFGHPNAFWESVVRRLLSEGVTVTVGYDDGHGKFYDDEWRGNQYYMRHWGTHEQWVERVCQHKLVCCGNTGTGWVAAATGVPLLTMEPPNSQMPDHRYRECGLRNLVDVVSEPDPEHVARLAIAEVRRKVVLTTGCYDILHAGHVRHLEKARALGTRLVVALNSDKSVKALKGSERPINPEGQRKTVLEALRCVDEVRITDDPLLVLQDLNPYILACGFGYTTDEIVGKGIIESRGGSVAVTCTGDAKDEPSTTKVVAKIKCANLQDIIAAAVPYSVNPPDKLKLLADEFLSVTNLPGDVADLGTCRGGTALVLRRLSDKVLHCFDTWTGTPYDDPMCHHKKGEWAASLGECERIVGDGTNTIYHKGVFPDSTNEWGRGFPSIVNKFCFVYVDTDTYQSVHDAIEFFWPRLVPGGKMVLDDYGWEPCAGVAKALDEWYVGIDAGSKRIVGYTCIVEKR